MPSIENIELSVGIDAGDTLTVLQNINKNIESMAKTSADTAKKTETAFTKMTQSIKSLLSIGAVIGVFKKAVGEATEAAKAQIVLENALKNVGLQYRDVAVQVERISKMNAVDDDDVKKVMAFATSLGVPKQRLAEFVETAYDFSAATGKDISLAMRTMSTAAKEGGVEWENWKNRLQGAGAAAANADGGIKNLGKQVNDLYEKLGKALMPVVTVIVGLLIRLADVLQGIPMPILAVSTAIVGLTVVMKAFNLTSPFGWMTIAAAGLVTLVASIREANKELKLLNNEQLAIKKETAEAKLKELDFKIKAWESNRDANKSGGTSVYNKNVREAEQLKAEIAEIDKIEKSRNRTVTATTGEMKKQAEVSKNIVWQGPKTKKEYANEHAKKRNERAPDGYDNKDIPDSAKELSQDYYQLEDAKAQFNEFVSAMGEATNAIKGISGGLKKAGEFNKDLQERLAKGEISMLEAQLEAQDFHAENLRGMMESIPIIGSLVNGMKDIGDMIGEGITHLFGQKTDREKLEGAIAAENAAKAANEKIAKAAAEKQAEAAEKQAEAARIQAQAAAEAKARQNEAKQSGYSVYSELYGGESASKKLEALNQLSPDLVGPPGSGAVAPNPVLRNEKIALRDDILMEQFQAAKKAGNIPLMRSIIAQMETGRATAITETKSRLDAIIKNGATMSETTLNELKDGMEAWADSAVSAEKIAEYQAEITGNIKAQNDALKEQQSLLESNLQTMIGAALINPENLADIQRIRSLMGQSGYSGAGMLSSLSGLNVRGLDGGGRSISIANLNLEVNEATGATVEATMAADVFSLFSGGRR
jgi:hypothetical protein